MNEIIFDKNLLPTERIILQFFHLQKSKNIIFSSRNLENILGISNPTISTATKSLAKKKYLKLKKIEKGNKGRFLIILHNFNYKNQKNFGVPGDTIDIINKTSTEKFSEFDRLEFLTPLQKYNLNPAKYPHPLGILGKWKSESENL